MKKSFGILLSLAIVAILLSACGGGTVISGEDMNGKNVSVIKGNELTVKLEGNPTTGYSWILVEGLDTSILKSMGDPEYKSESNMAGAGGTYTFKFKAVDSGTTPLKLVYLRTWETGVAPLKIFELTVTVP